MDVTFDHFLDLLSLLLLCAFCLIKSISSNTKSIHSIHDVTVYPGQRRKLIPPPPLSQPLDPTSSLPFEVLACIFDFVRISKWGYIRPRSILRVTWVCRQWRAVALSHAALWTQFDRSNAGWALQCLKRSKEALLDVNLMWEEDHIFPSLLVNLPRMRRLHLRSYPSSTTPTGRSEFWRQKAPNLLSLVIHDQTLPLDVFLENCRALQRLELHCCQFTWNTRWPTFAHLTVLRVEFRRPTVAISCFLQVLKGMPKLQWLTLDRVLLPHDWTFGELPQVQLPGLCCLGLFRFTPDTLFQFFSNVHFPGQNTSMWLDYDWTRTPDQLEAYRCLLQKSVELYPFSASLHIVEMHYGPDGEGSEQCFQYSPDGSNKAFVLRYPLDLLDTSIFPPHRQLVNLQTLVLRLDTLLSVAVWREVIAPLPLLEYLELSSTVASSFHIYLDEQFDHTLGLLSTDAATQTAEIFPSLRNLKYLGLPEKLRNNLNRQTVRDYIAATFFFKLQLKLERGLERVILAQISASGDDELLDVINAFKDVVDQVVVMSSGRDDHLNWCPAPPPNFFEYRPWRAQLDDDD